MNPDRRSENMDPRARNGERGTGNAERGTGTGDRGTGNGERGTRRGTGNAERGTGNAERGTGNAERGTGNAERGIGSPKRAAAFAPGTVSNVGCGFDVLGFALDQPGDVVIAIPREQPGVEILDITGDNGRLPRDPNRNTASVAAAALLLSGRPEGRPLHDRDGAADPRRPVAAGLQTRGVGLIIRKGLPLASGIGSSGASAVAAVLAVNEALALDAPEDVLLRSAMEGERVSAGAVHPDNVAPSMLGGFVLARNVDPPDMVRLPVPAGLACAVLCPALEVETRAARAILPEQVPLLSAVRQWANVGALVAALYMNDLDLLGRAMVDHIVEPHRAGLVPGFAHITRAAMDAGAIGCTLSGAGPAMFALCRSLESAERVGAAMKAALQQHGRIAGQVLVSRVSPAGAKVVDAVD
jgi:homoserine kinase